MHGVALRLTAQRLLMELTQFLFCFSATLVYVLEFIIDLGAARYNSKNLDWAYCTFRFKFHCKEVASLSGPSLFYTRPSHDFILRHPKALQIVAVFSANNSSSISRLPQYLLHVAKLCFWFLFQNIG
jgi:hypothetical protein